MEKRLLIFMIIVLSIVLSLRAQIVTTDFFCEGDTYEWKGHFEADGVTPLTFNIAGEYRDDVPDGSGNTTTHILQLHSIPTPAMTLCPDTTINPGEKVKLWATGADYIFWSEISSTTTLIQDGQQQYYASPTSTTKYIAHGYNIPDAGTNIVKNGDFELDTVDFTNDFTYFNPYPSTPPAYGHYTIADDIQGFWLHHVPSVKAYGGTGNMMIFDGMTTPNAVVWRQTVTVKPQTVYVFSAQVMSTLDSYLDGMYALLQFSINGQPVGDIFQSPNELHVWKKCYVIWYNSGNETTVELTIHNQNASGIGNDFAIDEIRFDEITTQCVVKDSVIITVSSSEPTLPTLTTEVTYDTIYWQPTYSFMGQEFSLAEYMTYLADGDVNLVLEFRDKVNCEQHKLYLTILSNVIVEQNDTTLCESELPLLWYNQELTSSGQYIYIEKRVDSEIDSVQHILNLVVIPTDFVMLEDSIYNGMSYEWNGVEYDTSGDYIDTLVNIYGCDSIVILRLLVIDNIVTINDILAVDQCADANVVELIVDYSGFVDSVALHFPQDTIDSISFGFYDVKLPMPVDGHIVVAYPSIRAGKYNTLVSGYFNELQVFSQQVELTYFYPSTVLEQRWDDVICVLTSGYNGGYDFVAFQWYKDGQELLGENRSYLSQPLEMGSEYSALLTEINGTQLMTCPIIAVEHADVMLYPTFVDRMQQIRCHLSMDAQIYLYDTMGKLCMEIPLYQGENYFHAPHAAGVYMAKIILLTGEERNVKLLVM